jgi:ABC-type transport system substrate-binding protein
LPCSYGYANDRVDLLVGQARVEFDRDRLKDIYRELQEIAYAEGPNLPLWHDVTIYAKRGRVQDFTLNWSFWPNLFEVSVLSR